MKDNTCSWFALKGFITKNKTSFRRKHVLCFRKVHVYKIRFKAQFQQFENGYLYIHLNFYIDVYTYCAMCKPYGRTRISFGSQVPP